MHSLCSRNQTLVIAFKKYAEVDNKRFLSFLIVLDFSILFEIIFLGLTEKLIFFLIN